ncbi:hypothetical protein ABW20_dc0100669 [Dactylellina cionopaga]|nr:hypothetical protein ABW20_dc0100669 [Dactylellina cionopaga]
MGITYDNVEEEEVSEDDEWEDEWEDVEEDEAINDTDEEQFGVQRRESYTKIYEEDGQSVLDEDFAMADKDDDSAVEVLSDGIYTPILRAKFEASPEISPLLGPSNLSPLPSPELLPSPATNLIENIINLHSLEPPLSNNFSSSLPNDFLSSNLLNEFSSNDNFLDDTDSNMSTPYKFTNTTSEIQLEVSNEKLRPVEQLRPKKYPSGYKARSSIPTTIPTKQYAEECVKAAFNSRLSAYHLHDGETSLLKPYLNHLHATTYLNIRNGILRLWHKNAKVQVTKVEAAGCAKDPRFFGLTEVAYDWLNRNGYINHGCLHVPGKSSTKKLTTRRKRKIAIIGAGISGLASARQIESLLAQHDEKLDDSDPTEVVIFEGRNRLGGRVYTHALGKDLNHPHSSQPAIDLGGQIVMGYEGGNPLAALIQTQLGIPYHAIDNTTAFPLYDFDGKVINDGRDEVLQSIHDDILDRLSVFKNIKPPTMIVEGNHQQIDACKDPWGAGGPPIALVEYMEQKSVIGSMGGLVSSMVAQELPSSQTVRKRIGKRKSSGVPTAVLPPPTKKQKLMSEKICKEALKAMVIGAEKITDAKGFSSLGKSMDKMFKGYEDVLKPDARDLRLYNWFHANLEYCNASAIDKPSLEHWDQDDGNEFSGAHSMIIGGYSKLAKGLYSTPTKLDVRIGHEVTKVKYDPDDKAKGVTLRFKDGSEFIADKVIITLPLGVLKNGSVQFDPPLPMAKSSAIDRLGFGLLNKVVMVYDKIFWDTAKDGFGCLRQADGDEKLLSSYEAQRGRFYMWWDATKVVGLPTLVGLMVGDAAEQIEKEADVDLVNEATSILKNCWGAEKVPDEPQESVVTRWRQDRFAGGTYSYIAAGSTGDDYDTIAEPLNDQIFFAGEHTNRYHPATVHGAYISGLRVAGEVATSVLGPIEIPRPLMEPRALKKTTFTATVSTTTFTAREPKAQASVAAMLPQKKRKATDELQREEATKKVWPAVVADSMAIPKPTEPPKATTNPYLIYQKAHFPIAKGKADKTKQEETGDPNARADRNEVRVVLGAMWRGEPKERQQVYKDQVKKNKLANSAALAKYKADMEEWEVMVMSGVGT